MPATEGGSGGGGARWPANFAAGNTPPTDPSQGNSGGAGAYREVYTRYGGGGGGGASTVGTAAIVTGGGEYDGIDGGNGGSGSACSITGTEVYYSGGGGGSSSGGIYGKGGIGGGGDRGVGGGDSLGGGGGCAISADTTGFDGGSGVVIVRYLTSKYTEGSVTGIGNAITIDGDYSVAKFVIDGTFTITEEPSYINIYGNSKISGNSRF